MRGKPEQIVLMMKSLEEADPAGKVLALDARTLASREGGAPEELAWNDEGCAFLKRRAEKLWPQVAAPVRGVLDRLSLRHVGWLGGFWPWLLLAGVFVVGWFSNELGPNRTVNILSFPLLGLTVWNLLVCGWFFVSAWWKKPDDGALSGRAEGMLGKVAAAATAGMRDEEQKYIATLAGGSFLKVWGRLTRPVQMARARMIFHLAAILLAGGVISSMYVQGLRKEYHAAWESTFLDEHSLHGILKVLLGPASAVTGVAVEGPEVLGQLRMVGGRAPAREEHTAAPWIHLYAATAAIFIFIPRLALLGMAWWGARSARVELGPGMRSYLESLKWAMEGRPAVVAVVPVHAPLDAVMRDPLRGICHQVWGGKVGVDFQTMIPYGGEDDFAEGLRELPPGVVFVFALAATPELEVQGKLIAEVRRKAMGESDLCEVLVILDSRGFDEKMKELPEYERRLAERQAAWARLLPEGSRPLTVNLEARQMQDRPTAGLREHLWRNRLV